MRFYRSMIKTETRSYGLEGLALHERFDAERFGSRVGPLQHKGCSINQWLVHSLEPQTYFFLEQVRQVGKENCAAI